MRGFNRAWSVKVRHNLTETIPLSHKAESYSSGTLYNYGDLPPRYPMPATIGTTHIYPECVVIYTPELVDGVPGITWWNESYGLPLPDDHGQWNPV